MDPLYNSPMKDGLSKQRQCLVVGNVAIAGNYLTEFLNQLPFFLPSDACGSLEEARELSRSKPYSMIWLDVPLTPQYELEHLRSLAKDVPVIVSSTSADLAVDGFEAGVADYLLKPFTFLRFIRAVNRALTVHASASIPEEHPFLFLKKGHTFQRFDHDHIDYIQAYGIYCKINGAGKMEVVNDTISRLEQVLPSQQFLRIHKSYIVNLSKVTGYSYRSISVGPHELPLGAAYRERFQGFLSLLGKKEGE